jgi:CO dehydrogenase maturation factor
MGTIERGRRGCACPENVLLREVLNHLILRQDEHIVVDMEAGIEHLGRGTAEGVDQMLVVVEPGWASIETAKRVLTLAADLGLRRVGVVANKVDSDRDAQFIRERLGDTPLLAVLPRYAEVEQQARSGTYGTSNAFSEGIARLAHELAAAVVK